MVLKQPSEPEIARWLKKWGFPARHIGNLRKMQGPSLKAAQNRSESILAGDSLLVVCGKRGPGKTQMATYWAQEAAKSSKRSSYYKAHKLLQTIRMEFDSDKASKQKSRDAMLEAERAKLLVIDEWSELAGTDWEKRTMTTLIDTRYDNKLSTVILTNHAPKEAVEAVGESIWSRAEETGGVVVCDWESYRKS